MYVFEINLYDIATFLYLQGHKSKNKLELIHFMLKNLYKKIFKLK